MAKKVVVIRVGEKTTHIVHMENTKSNPTIYGCVRIPTPEKAVHDGVIIDVVEIAKRIKKACRDKGIKTKDVIFTISSSKIASRETTIPVVNKTKIQQTVMMQVSDLFPVDTDSYLFTYILEGKPREDKDASRVQDVRIFAAPSDLVECYYTLAETADLHVLSIEADSNSIYEIMRRQVRNGVTMAIQLDYSSTLVNIMTGDRLLLQRLIPYGINAFAEVMLNEEAFQLKDIDEAYEMLKNQRVILTHLGEKNPDGDFSLEKRIEVTDNGEYMISNISRVVEYYSSRYKDRPIHDIICSGVGCSVAGIHELISNEIGLSVRRPEVLEGIRFNRKVTIDSALLQYVNCFGAVFQPIRFIPKEVARKEAKKGALTGSVLIFIMLFMLSGILAAFSMIQVINATDERDMARSRHDALKPIETEFHELTGIVANYALYETIKSSLDTNGNHFHELLDKISAVCPKSFKIQNISATEQRVVISAVSVDKLSSLSKLQMQLGKIEEITNVKINQISESKQALSRKKMYTYTIGFEYAEKTVDPAEGEVQ